MLSFHNNQGIKDKYLKRVQEHAAADNIIQGTGWENGKGCAVGCTLENYDHKLYPIELGLPEWLARLEDTIFEGLDKEKAKNWPERLLKSIPVGVDTQIVFHQIAIRRMDRLIALQTKALEAKHPKKIYKIIKEVIEAIKAVKKCHEAYINENVCEVDFESARSAANSAANSAAAAWSAEAGARSAAWSAAWPAAWSAALSAAWPAAASARSAARSAAAWSAETARSAAWSAAFEQEAEDLLELLSALKKE